MIRFYIRDRKFLAVGVKICLLVLTSSCRNDIFLDINFGLSDSTLNRQINDMLERKELYLGSRFNDTAYYRDIKIAGTNYKVEVFFNPDDLRTGPLRSYDFSFATTPFSLSGNDTTLNGVNNIKHFEVFRVSDFEKVKKYLDKRFGDGVFSVRNNNVPFGNDTVYHYVSENAALFLGHNKKHENYFFQVPIRVPFYTKAYLEVRSKSYDADYASEKRRRRDMLAPDEVLYIAFDSPKVEDNAFGYMNHGANYEQEYSIVVNSVGEYYKTYVVDEDITECKGVLSILDPYDDTLFSSELIYKFKRPLVSPKKGEWREVKYNSYEIKSDAVPVKLKRAIRNGAVLKTRFTPTAVVLRNGDVIK